MLEKTLVNDNQRGVKKAERKGLKNVRPHQKPIPIKQKK
jgi:hypothetical protein